MYYNQRAHAVLAHTVLKGVHRLQLFCGNQSAHFIRLLVTNALMAAQQHKHFQTPEVIR